MSKKVNYKAHKKDDLIKRIGELESANNKLVLKSIDYKTMASSADAHVHALKSTVEKLRQELAKERASNLSNSIKFTSLGFSTRLKLAFNPGSIKETMEDLV